MNNTYEVNPVLLFNKQAILYSSKTEKRKVFKFKTVCDKLLIYSFFVQDILDK